jgi:transcriptional regulator with XRE-family HTH domain
MALARSAGVSRATLEALENGRLGELGYSKLSRILAVLGWELALREASPRPTLDDLMEENCHDQSVGGRR